MIEYTHTRINEEVYCIAGYYAPGKEGRIKYKDKEVLYVLGNASVESGCCGPGSWSYVNVPGYVIHWQTKTNESNLLVSDIEPVHDKNERLEIEKILRDSEPTTCDVLEINFW